jgi:uncharacterized repeat protein (TIGR01451 family)
VSIIIISILIFEIIPDALFNKTNSASAATATIEGTDDKLDVKQKWIDQMNTLKWFDSVDAEGLLSVSSNSAFWHKYEESDLTVKIDTNRITYVSTSEKKSEGTSSAIGSRIKNQNDFNLTDYYLTEGVPISDSAYNGSSSSYDLYYTIERAEGYDTYNEDGEITKKAYCRRYYVSNAAQLANIFSTYGSSSNSTNTKMIAQTDEINNALNEINDSTTSYDAASKVEIYLLCDIDLGGVKLNQWSSKKNINYELELNGQGHYIYNGYLPNNYFLGTGDNKFAIENVTFSNFYIGHSGGMFGNSVYYAYFNNVNWENCVAADSGTSTSMTIVLGNMYRECYFKDCTIRNAYVRANGGGHSSFFASYNNTTGEPTSLDKDKNISYFEDNDTNIQSYYYTNIPDLNETERAWYGNTSLNETKKKLSSYYPSIYEGCATISCALYETSTDTSNIYHSGGFVSCICSKVIFKNCYSNTSVYGSQQLGVFLGGIIGNTDGFYYEDPTNTKKERIFVNSIFESCYSAGKVEGVNQIGGFIGVIYNDGRAIGKTGYFNPFYGGNNAQNSTDSKGYALFYNCYSTSSVGMEYSGEYVGGFVGLIRGNRLCGTMNKSENKHRFVNCYAAGEVGGITTRTDNNGTNIKVTSSSDVNDNTIGGFIGVYRPEDYYINDEESSSEFYNVADLSNPITGITTDCYYDMQTTGMREREIGTFNELSTQPKDSNNNFSDNKSKAFQLSGTLSGLNGVYTRESKDKQISGLTNSGKKVDGSALFSTGLNVATSWTYIEGYYPQLSYFTEKPTELSAYASEVDKMIYYRKVRYYYDSIASTATVYLNHYDELLDTDGNTKSVDEIIDNEIKAKLSSDNKTLSDLSNKEYDEQYSKKLTNYQAVYDTVRDITSKFEMTSDNYLNSVTNNIAWATDDAANSSSGFVSTLGESSSSSDDDEKIEITYSIPINDSNVSTDDTNSDSTKTYTQTYTPHVLSITKVENDEGVSVYKCLNFAPGKQWIAVTATSTVEDKFVAPGTSSSTNNQGTDDSTASQNYISGSRQLRLLPTAYLSAGNIIHVNVVTNETTDENGKKTTTYTNDVYYTDSETGEVKISNFNHSIGVAYAITDRFRMGQQVSKVNNTSANDNSSIYKSQQLDDYTKSRLFVTNSTKQNQSSAYFAYYDQFNEEGNNKLFANVKKNTDSSGNTTYSFSMLDQKFSTDTMIVPSTKSYLANNSTYGSTLVRIYKGELKDGKLNQKEEIDYSDESTLAKWQGMKEFEESDEGYYYLYYYWRLNDGRYLMDTKLVRITTNQYDVTMITGILDEELTVDDERNTAIDQYVTDNVKEADDGTWNLEGSFPSSDKDFNSATAANYYDKDSDGTSTYNSKLDFDDATYYTKSLTISTIETTTAVEWKRTTDYSLTTLIIKAVTKDGKEYQMARIDDFSGDETYTLESAEYAYQSTNYTVSQDPETKLFYITQQDSVPVTFSVQSGSLDTDSISKYIVFNFETTSNNQANSYSTVSDNLVITALFRRNTADVTGTKSVLLKSDDVKDEVDEVESTKKVYVKLNDDSASNDKNLSESSEYTSADEVENTDEILKDKSTSLDESGNITEDDNSNDTEVDTSKGTEDEVENNSTGSKYTVENVDYKYWKALSDTQKQYEVDDYGITSDSSRLAALPGDTLTYRVKLKNVGFFESGEVRVTDSIPENCTYVDDSMKIYRQKIDTSRNGEYGELELVAELSNGEVNYGSDDMKALYSGYIIAETTTSNSDVESANTTSESDAGGESGNTTSVEFSPITFSDNNLEWIIPGITLDYDYYVQYDVTVDELSSAQAKRTLTNTAEWSFKCHNGNVIDETTDSNSSSDTSDSSEGESGNSGEAAEKTEQSSMDTDVDKTESSSDNTAEKTESSLDTTVDNSDSSSNTIDKSSLSYLLQNEIFNITMDYVEDSAESNSNSKSVKYTVDFDRKNTGKEYKEITFTNEMPTGFTLENVTVSKNGTKVYYGDVGADGTLNETVDKSALTTDNNSGTDSTITTDSNSSSGSNTSQENSLVSDELTITYYSNKSEFVISGLSVDESDSYEIVFAGTQKLLGEEYTDENSESKVLDEIKNKSTVTYIEIEKVTENDDNGNSVPKNVENTKGNSVTRIERLSNTVETDVIHLYYEIDKKIESEVSDLSQSFLFKVTYYKNQAEFDAAKSEEDSAYLEEDVITEDASENKDADFTEGITVNEDVESKVEVSENTEAGTDNSNTIATEESEENVSYVRISCDTKSTVTKSDGTKATVWTGSKLIQCDKRGIYVIEELTDWSSTDYDFIEIINNQTDTNNDSAGNSSAESSQNTALSEATENLDEAEEAETIKSTVLKMYIDSTDYYNSPNAYTLAIPTQVGTYLSDLTNHTVTFINSPSDYAYLSSQAYIENNFK